MIDIVKRDTILRLITDMITLFDIEVLPIKGGKSFSGRENAEAAVEYIEQFDVVSVRLTDKGSDYHKDGSGYIGFIGLKNIRNDKELVILDNIKL